MSSVGIPEGSSFQGSPCHCLWISTASIPPMTRLEKKCDWCKAEENKEKTPAQIKYEEKIKREQANLDAIMEQAMKLLREKNSENP